METELVCDAEFNLEPAVCERLVLEAEIEKITISEAVNTAIKEWCESRAYMRSGNEERRGLIWKMSQKHETNYGEITNSG